MVKRTQNQLATDSPKRDAFVREYLIDLNATQAAIRAGYSPNGAEVQGHRLLSDAKVQAAVQAASEARAKRTGITADMVLRELWSIGTADANELIEYRRVCCRHCWGDGHRYQFTEGEMRERRDSFDRKSDKADAEVWDADGLFDEGGGIGFDGTRDPNPDCPECFGDGVGSPIIKDTRNLSEDAKRLYAGVKVTKEGIEVKMHDKVAALINVGRHLGMFVDRKALENPDGTPINVGPMIFAAIYPTTKGD